MMSNRLRCLLTKCTILQYNAIMSFSSLTEPSMRPIEFSLADAAVVARDTCAKANIMGSIATVRALQQALDKFGVKSECLSVRVLIFNPYVTKEFRPGHSPSKKRLNALLDHPKGHSIALGMSEAKGDGWKGHLVLTVKNIEGTWLIDPTLNQANRPEHKIWMLPIGVKVEDEFGAQDGTRAILKLNDCAVMYSAFPSDESYKNVSDWTWKSDEFDVDVISNQIFERLAAGA